MRSLAAALELPVGELLAKSGWTGAEGAFPPDELQRPAQGPTEPEDKGDKLEHQSYRPAGSSDEIQQLRQEIMQLREAVELLQKTLASNSVSFRADGDGRGA
jgi:hypothetical protein